MTIIAGFVAHGVPILMGDLLATWYSGGEAPQLAALPSHASFEEIYEPGCGVSWTLCQKVLQVNPYFAIAWAGSYIHAAETIGELRELCGDLPPDNRRLADYLRAVANDRSLNELCLIGLYVDNSREIKLFHKGARELDVPVLGSRAFFAGTGAEDFAWTLERSPPPIVNGPPDFNAIAAVHSLQATFLTREIHGRGENVDGADNPLHWQYGGGYDFALALDGRVGKLGEMTTLCWQADVDGLDVELHAPTLFVRKDYIGKSLVLRWGRSRPWTVRTVVPWDEQHCVAVRPMLEPAAPIPADPNRWPSFATTLEAHAIFVRRVGSEPRVLAWLHGPLDNVHGHVRFEEHSDARATVVRVRSRNVRNDRRQH